MRNCVRNSKELRKSEYQNSLPAHWRLVLVAREPAASPNVPSHFFAAVFAFAAAFAGLWVLLIACQPSAASSGSVGMFLVVDFPWARSTRSRRIVENPPLLYFVMLELYQNEPVPPAPAPT